MFARVGGLCVLACFMPRYDAYKIQVEQAETQAGTHNLSSVGLHPSRISYGDQPPDCSRSECESLSPNHLLSDCGDFEGDWNVKGCYTYENQRSIAGVLETTKYNGCVFWGKGGSRADRTSYLPSAGLKNRICSPHCYQIDSTQSGWALFKNICETHKLWFNKMPGKDVDPNNYEWKAIMIRGQMGKYTDDAELLSCVTFNGHGSHGYKVQLYETSVTDACTIMCGMQWDTSLATWKATGSCRGRTYSEGSQRLQHLMFR